MVFGQLPVGGMMHKKALWAISIVGGFYCTYLREYAQYPYIESEYRSWLVEAGFTESRCVVMTDGASIITARKPL